MADASVWQPDGDIQIIKAVIEAMKGTSVTSITIGLGSKTFTTQINKLFTVGQFLLIVDAANINNFMHGQVTAYNSLTGILTVNVILISGSGTIANWTIAISGIQGPAASPITTFTDLTVSNSLTVNADAAVNTGYTSMLGHVTAMDIWNAAPVIIATSAAVITDFPDAPQIGARRRIYPLAGTVLTNNINLLVQGGANYTTVTGDAIEVTAVTVNIFRLDIIRTDGLQVTSTSGTQEFRLSLAAATPVVTIDVTSTTLYCVPYKGNRISLYDGVRWNVRASADFSVAVPAGTNAMHDVFCYDNAGVPTLETLAWTNNTTRATALAYQDGVLVKSGTPTRRYLGSLSTDGVSGECADTVTARFLWNYYNRITRSMKRADITDNWVYTTAAYRQAGGNTANKLEYVVGVAEDIISITVLANSQNTVAAIARGIGIGIDSTTSDSSDVHNGAQVVGMNEDGSHTAAITYISAVGRHYAAWLEISVAAGTTTWNGDAASATQQSGMTGFTWG